MLYVVYGTNRDKTGAYVAKMVSALLKKRPHADVFTVTPETFWNGDFERYVGGSGLFENKHIVRLEGLLGDEKSVDAVLGRLPDIAESEHIFILREESLTTPLKKKCEKYAKEVKNFDAKEEKKAAFNVFGITDALAARDKKKLWMLYREAIDEGLVPEEIHGTLWWQTKTLLQVASGDTEGMKPFVVGKAKRALGAYTKEELERLARELIHVYHDARRGLVELEVGLEKVLLGL